MTLIRLLFAAALFVAPAVAAEFAIETADMELTRAMWTCSEHMGDDLPEEARVAGCQTAIELLFKISTNGYCYDEATDGWRKCESAD